MSMEIARRKGNREVLQYFQPKRVGLKKNTLIDNGRSKCLMRLNPMLAPYGRSLCKAICDQYCII
jgi:hypothetical protein